MNFYHIWSVAAYEGKTLFRSWFFRIFALLAVLILFGINMGFFGPHSDARWTYRAIAANLPYMNTLFINVAQAVIAVFLASDFLRRDRKLDTTEVIYARPITNGEYVAGKTMGIIILFLAMVVMALVMSLIFNLIRKDTPVVPEAYLYYPLLINLPTLVYILGLSFLLMILLRSQAVTLLILLGYIGLTLIYFRDKAHGLLDYMAFNLPLVYSDFTGFADLERIMLHRLTYLLAGIGFIFATIRFLHRLPQTGRWNFLNLFLFLFFLALGAGAGFRYIERLDQIVAQREEYLEMNNRYARKPVVDITDHHLDVKQMKRNLVVRSSVRFRNHSGERLDTLLFSLNPGFRIDSITGNKKAATFHQTGTLVRIIPESPLEPGHRGGVEIFYRGTPNHSSAYLDIPEEKRLMLKKAAVATFDKQPGIIHARYLLLTPELNWYPVSGAGFNMIHFEPRVLDFSRFTLTVKPDDGMAAIAPGRIDTLSNGAVRFLPGQDLSAMPLVIAPLKRRSMVIDQVEYNLYLHPEHDYFSGYFSEIGDTLAALVMEEKERYEVDDLDLYYPFRRINLVEVPIHYHPYERPYIQSVETILPEMILLPEKGAGVNTLDFQRFRLAEERRDREQESERSKREVQMDQFRRFLSSTFFQTDIRSRGAFGRGGEGEELFVYNNSDELYSMNPYCVFPLYYSYMTGISSLQYPVLNSMIESYLKEGFEVEPREGFRGGITEKERANLALRENSMIELFAEWDTELTSSLVNQTGSFVISALKNRVGMGNFDNFLYYYLEENAFKVIPYEKFSRDFYLEFGVEMAPYLEVIRTGGGMATFLLSEPEYIQTRDEVGEVYLVRMRITNVGDGMGLVDLNFRIMGQGGFGSGSGMSEEKRLYEIPAGETREIQVALYDRPMLMTINTLISGNIPSSYNHFLRSATEKEILHQEEYSRATDQKVTLSYEGEYIVDNEDPDCIPYSFSMESKLKQYIDSRKEPERGLKYQQLNRWWNPPSWTPVAHSAYYGAAIRSALVIARGDGSSYVTWKTRLRESGFYEVYVYIPVSAMLEGPRRGENREGRGESPGGGNRRTGPSFADKGTDYHYSLSSMEGSEEVVYELNDPEDGWNRLGSFHFPADSVFIRLTNETDGNRVIADAVKLILSL